MLDVMVKTVKKCAVIALNAKSVIMCLETVLKDVNQGTEGLLAKKVDIYFQRRYQCDTFNNDYDMGYQITLKIIIIKAIVHFVIFS